MKIDMFHKAGPNELSNEAVHLHRVEVPILGTDERQWKIVLLDADDSFDVVVQDPLGERECVWSLVKDTGEATSEAQQECPHVMTFLPHSQTPEGTVTFCLVCKKAFTYAPEDDSYRWEPMECKQCGEATVFWDEGEGFTCSSCHATDLGD